MKVHLQYLYKNILNTKVIQHCSSQDTKMQFIVLLLGQDKFMTLFVTKHIEHHHENSKFYSACNVLHDLINNNIQIINTKCSAGKY